jgi:hypothetical protein
MNDSSPPAPDAQRLEEMVAYLDGELTSDESARVEQRLAADEKYRLELQGIERAWTALDQLPLTKVDDNFSKTTMEMVVHQAQQDIDHRTRALPVVRRRNGTTLLGIAVVAMTVGIVAARQIRSDPNADLVRDLAVINRVDVYTQFEEVEFLRQLQPHVHLLKAGIEGLSHDPATSTPPPDNLGDTEAQHRAWLENLDAYQQTTVRARYNRFRSLPADEQHRLRALHREIVTSQDAQSLQDTVVLYGQWLANLPPARQFELRSLPLAQRVDTIASLAAEMQEDAALTLTEQQLRAVFRAVREPMPRLLKEIEDELRRADHRGIPRERSENQLRYAMILQAATGRGPAGEIYQAVLAALPPESAKAFELLAPERRRERLQGWIRQATVLRGEVSRQELERFFAEELDPSVREELLLLPPGEMEDALKRLYRKEPEAGWGGWGRRARGSDRPRDRLRPPGPNGPNGPFRDGPPLPPPPPRRGGP